MYRNSADPNTPLDSDRYASRIVWDYVSQKEPMMDASDRVSPQQSLPQATNIEFHQQRIFPVMPAPA
jgi:hypothetical protein